MARAVSVAGSAHATIAGNLGAHCTLQPADISWALRHIGKTAEFKSRCLRCRVDCLTWEDSVAFFARRDRCGLRLRFATRGIQMHGVQSSRYSDAQRQ